MKNKIYKYDFLVVGAGLIGSLAALALHQNNFKVLVIDKQKDIIIDKRTLAVNANSMDFLNNLGIWASLKSKPQPINKIIIKDYINNSPIIFENTAETMGKVIFNSELLEIARKRLKNLKIIKTNVNINLDTLLPNKITFINNSKYYFKKIVLSMGKKNISENGHKNVKFDQGHMSFVGFFNHKKKHKNYAYEIFNSDGPLAVLPAPSNSENKSTFIYSTKNNITSSQIKLSIKKNFMQSHGQIYFDKLIYKFPITPHLTKENKNYIYIGDSLKSIHPVAGQGWNLGIKDIQKLIFLSKNYSLEDNFLNSIYYSNRIFESTLYLSFTSLLNFLYEKKNPIYRGLIKVGYLGLQRFKIIRNLFIKQAMGRSNLV